MLRIYPRLKLDITWLDLAVAATALAFTRDHAHWTRRAEQEWGSSDDVFACLCVRTGWDLLLGALDLPRGSEVLLSAITISHMAEVIRAHGLVPVPVDIDPETLEPKVSEMERLVTPRTKVLLVAHLFGARIDITPLSDFAVRHDLLFVEDCAQAFTGRRDCIDNLAAVSMISFGPIKTATALGGGILIVRRPDLLQKMRAAEAALPLFPTGEFAQRVLKFSFLKFLSIPIVFGIFCRIMKALGRDVEAMLGGSGRAFPQGELLRHIRHRAPAPMMKLLTRRLKKYDGSVVRERAKVGRALMQQLHESPTLRTPGRKAGEHTFWVFPVSAKAPADLARRLRSQGFDCTVGASAMRVIEGDAGEQCPGASQVLEGILYLPVQTGLRRREVGRLALAVT